MEDVLDLARRITKATGAPVVGGVAVILYGWGRSTPDIDLYSRNFAATSERLAAAGCVWHGRRGEFMLEDVPVHLVGDDALGGPPERMSTRERIRVVSLADLVRSKLTSGLQCVVRVIDIADVVELIRCVPLKKDFALKLPAHLRGPFKQLVEQVHGPRRTTIPTLRLWGLA